MMSSENHSENLQKLICRQGKKYGNTISLYMLNEIKDFDKKQCLLSCVKKNLGFIKILIKFEGWLSINNIFFFFEL